jgi:hypothetical protein
MRQDSMLKFVFEYLLVPVNDEHISDEVEHHTSSRPFFILGVLYNFGQTIWSLSVPPRLEVENALFR